MSKTSEVVGGGTLATVPEVPAAATAPVEEGGVGTSLEDAPQEPEGSALK